MSSEETEGAVSGPLAGLTVVELGEWIAAPYAGKIMADFGARVVKAEVGEGDPTRKWGPFPETSVNDPEASGMFGYLNAGKESWSFSDDSDFSGSLESILSLIRASDVLIIDQFFLARLPTDFLDSVSIRNEALLVATITPYGLDGPYANYRAYNINTDAASGLSYGIGERDRAPLPMPMSQGEHQAGLSLAIAILMGLQARDRDGMGQRVDVSTMEMIASLHTAFFLPRFLYEGGIVGCRDGRLGASPTYPNTILPCKDGLVALNSVQVRQWIRFVQLMGEPDWSKKPRYRDRRAMIREYKEEVDALIVPWLMERTKRELYNAFLANRIPSAPVLGGVDLLNNDHLHARGALYEGKFPTGERFWAPSPPYHFTRSHVESGQPPALGQNQGVAVVSGELAPRPTTKRPNSQPPMEGIRVLDLGTAWAGGLAGRFLADFGADVIKIESWSHMDGSRQGRPILVIDEAGGDAGLWPELQPGFHMLGRGKRSLTLNLQNPGGRELMLRLVRTADVVIHNFSDGVMERLNLAPDVLLAENPQLVIAGQSVAGYTGPARKYIGYGGGVSALSGLASTVGYEGEDPLAMFQGLYSDVVSALTIVCGALAGLVERSKSGQGQAVSVSQWEATMALSEELLLLASIRGEEMGSAGFRHPLLVPHGVFPCRTSDDDDPTTAWLSIAVGSDAEWRGLLDQLQEDGIEIAERAGAWSVEDRRTHRKEIDDAIESWTRDRDRFQATADLQARGVAAAPATNIVDIFGDAQLHWRQQFVDVEHPLVGSEPMPGLAWHLIRTPGQVSVPAPLLGQHTRDIIIEELGVTRTEFDKLVEVGAVEVKPSEHGPMGANAVTIVR